MKHLIMGTAGHVDHGKTALVKALTGIECDTHAQEKQRGITINLGFAHIDLPSGLSVGIVDVPGHRNFVHTMVAGASGIDLALMVIAADSGVMPQTREHLQIMQVLSATRGVIALSKVDLVEEEIVEMACEEIGDMVAGTFLEGAAPVPVSSVTGAGLPDLVKAIDACACSASQRPAGEIFRMFVDRIFTVSGFGSVVTGSVLGGTVRTGDHVRILPPDRELRVRRLERHGQEVTEVTAGDRASMNLVGLDKEDFARGMIIADRSLRATSMLDARLHMFHHARRLDIWSQAIFLMGTYEAQARIHLIDRNTVSGDGNALVQVHLPKPCVASAGDRFVLRGTSSDMTLGGGEVIDAFPLHHRRRPISLVEDLARIARGRLAELVVAEVGKHRGAILHRDIADTLNVSRNDVGRVIEEGLPGNIAVFRADEEIFLIVEEEYRRIADATLKSIATHHRRNPLAPGGRSVEELLGALGVGPAQGGDGFLRQMLGRLAQEGKVKQQGHTWALASHHIEVTPALKRGIDAIESLLNGCGMSVPLGSHLKEFAAKHDIDDRRLGQILRYLVDTGRACQVEGSYLSANVVVPVRLKLLARLDRMGDDGLTVAGFRDLVSGNRKMCLLLYALFDNEGITERRGDVRVITEKGKKILCSSRNTHGQ